MKHFVAVLAAAAMIAAAIVVRGAIDGNGGESGDRLRLVCASELGSVCADLERVDGVDVMTEDASATASRVASGGREGFDGWLAPEPLVQQAREDRARQRGSTGAVSPLPAIARSPLVLATWQDRAAVLRARCGGRITWKCIGDATGAPWSAIGGQATWGEIKPGQPAPAATAAGRLVLGQQAAAYFGRVDLDRDDFDDDGFLAWFTRLQRAMRTTTGSSAFARMLVEGPAAFDVVGALEAEAGPARARASEDRRRDLELIYPEPVATAGVVYLATSDAGDGRLRDIVNDDGARALARSGWRVDGQEPARGIPGTPALPRGTNLPSAGALEALYTTWRTLRG